MGSRYQFSVPVWTYDPTIKSCSIFNFFHPAVWIIQDGKESNPIQCLFSQVETSLYAPKSLAKIPNFAMGLIYCQMKVFWCLDQRCLTETIVLKSGLRMPNKDVYMMQSISLAHAGSHTWHYSGITARLCKPPKIPVNPNTKVSQSHKLVYYNYTQLKKLSLGIWF